MIGVLEHGRRRVVSSPWRGLALLGSLVACLFGLCLGTASADVPPLVSYGTFFAEQPGIAVDQATGDVFTDGSFSYCEEGEVKEEIHVPQPCGFGGGIEQFDAEGNLIRKFGPTSFYTAAAVNPVNKDLYAFNGFGEIEEYVPSTGALVTSFSVPKSNNFFSFLTVVQIAADASGNVYVPVAPENKVVEYSEAGTLLKTYTGSGSSALNQPTGVAVDGSGNVWVADSANNRIEEFDSSGTAIGEIQSDRVADVAVDAAGNVFALDYNNSTFCGASLAPCLHMVEYSPTGTVLLDVGAGSFGRTQSALDAFSVNSLMALDPSTDRAYVSDISNGFVWMYAPPKAPEVGKESAVDVTISEADLGASVNAGGLPTGYRFEYGTSEAYGGIAPLREEHAAGTKAHTVWASVGGLAPGTTYHYRVVVHNELGTIEGADETFTTPAAKGACPNEALRGGQSATLPDCRAYEIITPPSSSSAEPDTVKGQGIQGQWGKAYEGGGFVYNRAARDGDGFAYWAIEVLPGSESSGMQYVAQRGPNGWSSENVIPLQSYDNNFCNNSEWGNVIEAYSSQLTKGVLRVGANERSGDGTLPANAKGGCGAEGLEIVQGEPINVENLLLRDNAARSYTLMNPAPQGTVPTDAHFEGASADLSRVYFKENTRLTENGPAGEEGLYEDHEGTLRLASELPNGAAVAGSLAVSWQKQPSVVSSDGSRAFFTAAGNLYERINGEQTVQLDEPQGGTGPGGGGEFQYANSDGTQVYFTDDAAAGLTTDTIAGSGKNLYRYSNGQLTDLTPVEHAEVSRALGVSQEGVYFVASSVLSGTPNEHGETAQPGQSNVYEWQNGATTFIVTGGFGTPSPNGMFLAFSSERSLTGYNNVDQKTGAHDSEIYLYDSGSRKLACVSCDVTGEAPSAQGAQIGGSFQTPTEGVPHNLSNNGRLVFQTKESLLPSDTNGQMDVYEYEEGQLHLITTGTANEADQLLDVSEEGSDVFFLSRQPLVSQDHGGEGETNIIYDAREGGGFAEVASPPACTSVEACREPAGTQPVIYGSPSSETFSGTGNVVPPEKAKPKKRAVKKKPAPRCRKNRGKKKAKCVTKKSKKSKKAKKTAHKGGR